MTQNEHSIRGRGGKMHPLFVELYMSGDLDDSDEAEEERKTERARARQRRRILQKRVNRRV
jgi:hypothetical protein